MFLISRILPNRLRFCSSLCFCCVLWRLPVKYESAHVHPRRQLGRLEKGEGVRDGGGRRWDLPSDWSGVTYLQPLPDVRTQWEWEGEGEGEGDCGVVSLNKMAARPLSARPLWTPTMTGRCLDPHTMLLRGTFAVASPWLVVHLTTWTHNISFLHFKTSWLSDRPSPCSDTQQLLCGFWRKTGWYVFSTDADFPFLVFVVLHPATPFYCDVFPFSATYFPFLTEPVVLLFIWLFTLYLGILPPTDCNCPPSLRVTSQKAIFNDVLAFFPTIHRLFTASCTWRQVSFKRAINLNVI